MDWSWWGGLLGWPVGTDQLQRIVLLMSASANLVALIAALYAFWRWWTRPPKDRKAASALRDEGEFRASLNHRQRAMELYDLSIRLNPGAAHVYYLRGCLLEEIGRINQAIAAWERCVECLPNHPDALQKLSDYSIETPSTTLNRWAFRLSAAGAVVILMASAFVGIWH
jgi:tetratricopeptide (TPR) repeat protein